MRLSSLYNLVIIAVTISVSACSGGSYGEFNGDSSYYDSDTPKIEKQKTGRPYQISGRWYTPTVDNDYDRVGIASWYGPGFDGRPTSNGEKFDEDKISAAHTTLPIPSYVEVTNLDNGKQLYVRINDRGPFVDDRLIDLSKRAAELLGVKATGLARVRVALAPPPRNITLITPDGQKIMGKPYTPSHRAVMVAQNTPPKMSKNPQIQSDDLPLYTSSVIADNSYDVPAVDYGNKNYAIKIGVFSDANNIASLYQNLAPLGNVQIEPIYHHGKPLSRISLTGYKTQEEALHVMNNLADIGIYDAKIMSQ